MAICDLNLRGVKKKKKRKVREKQVTSRHRLPFPLPFPLPAYLHASVSVSLFSLNAERTVRVQRVVYVTRLGGPVCFAPANRRVLSLKFDSVQRGKQ